MEWEGEEGEVEGRWLVIWNGKEEERKGLEKGKRIRGG
jgi:hypothetical protein